MEFFHICGHGSMKAKCKGQLYIAIKKTSPIPKFCGAIHFCTCYRCCNKGMEEMQEQRGSNPAGLQELRKVSTGRCHLNYVLKKEQEFAGLKRVRRAGTPHAKAQRHERIQCF